MRIVYMRAVDWATYHNQQYPIDTEFDLTRGTLVGIVLAESDEQIVLASQLFDVAPGETGPANARGILTIPKVCILEMRQIGEVQGWPNEKSSSPGK